jgi:predicted nucleotidyltransferase
MPDAPAELDELLAVLVDGGVEFILVGGAAALIHGAPITTQDVDIVHRRDPANVARLLTVLERLDAFILDLARRRLRPTAQGLEAGGQILLTTRVGRLDALGMLHDGRGYDELITHTDVVDFDGHELRIIDLETLIEIKSSTGRAKDRLTVPILLELARIRAQAAEV